MQVDSPPSPLVSSRSVLAALTPQSLGRSGTQGRAGCLEAVNEPEVLVAPAGRVRWRRVLAFYGLTLTLTTVAAVFHGTCSGTSLVAVAFVSGGDELLTGFTGAAGMLSAAAGCALAVAFLTRGATKPLE